ncbi:MAG: N-acetyl-gamma-glutamyl-phosphate reductase [Thermodesulfobacteriota bacterium]|nr:N-acetyl-gamma-glutamyl-phosphate reductase [Thermodesulfobacteriota bacterium]
MLKVGIYGASGYTGQELFRLLTGHPDTEVTTITSRKFKNISISEVYPVFAGITDMRFADSSPEIIISSCEVVFLALPHTEAMKVAPEFIAAGMKVIDLSADFRLSDVSVYEEWYIKHTAPDLMPRVVYGLPELHRDDLKGAQFVANPGCYPTGIILGLAPLLEDGCIDTSSIIADSKSGVSGSGRELQIGSLFCEVNEGFKAYKIGSHRHTPEIEQELGRIANTAITISFSPHLVPISRGILNTVYADLNHDISETEILDNYEKFYRNEKFVRICNHGRFPNISSVRGSNNCDIGIAVDGRTGRVIVVSAIDNLIKGAAGQAVQNMNLMCGLREDAGLDHISMFP